MTFSELMLRADSAIIVIGLFIVLLLIAEVGYGIGQSNAVHAKERKPEIVQQGLMTLLSLLLAFTVSMAATRFEERAATLIEEANAIGSTYLISLVFPKEPREKLDRLLKQYLDARIEYVGAGKDRPKAAEAHRRALELQKEIWSIGADLGREKPTVIISLFLNSLTQTINLQAKEEFAYERRVPKSILGMLFLISAMVVGLLGYGYGPTGQRHIIFTGMFTVAVALVLFVIIDLNRPEGGWIRVHPDVLIDLRKNLNGS